MTEGNSRSQSGESEGKSPSMTEDLQVARKFLVLVRTFDKLSGISDSSYDQAKSRYQATSSGRELSELELMLEEFFGSPKKRAGDPLPMKLRLHPLLRLVDGPPDELSLFVRKSETGFFFGALQVLDKEAASTAIQLGFVRKKSFAGKRGDSRRKAKEKSLSKRIVKELDVGSGLVNGVGLATFLQEAEQEKASCVLRVESQGREGRLFIRDGVLIAAETGTLKDRTAAAEILGWVDTTVDVEAPGEKTENEVGQPLVRTFAEALKIRKQGEKKAPKAAAPEEGQAPSDKEKAVPAAGKGGKKKGKEKPKRKRRLVPALLVFIVLIAGGYGGFQWYKAHEAKQEYLRTLSQAESQADPNSGIRILKGFINTRPSDPYRKGAEAKIGELTARADKVLYDRTMKQLEAMPFDAEYQPKAEAVLSQYLKKYPDGKYKAEVEERLERLQDDIEEHYYGTAQEAKGLDTKARADNYREYLAKFPQGKYRPVVQKWLDDMAQKEMRDLEVQIVRCRQMEQRDPCLALCDDFLTLFEGSSTIGTVSEWRQTLRGEQDMAELSLQVAGAGEDLSKRYDVIREFLGTHSGSPAKAEIQQRLAAAKKSLDEQMQWRKIEAYGKDSSRGLPDRLSQVSAYIEQNSASPYRKQALSLKRELEASTVSTIRTSSSQTTYTTSQTPSRKETAPAGTTGPDRQTLEKLRLEALRQETAKKLGSSQGRFISNGDGTVTDTRTNLVWSLLDSFQELNGCHDYETAQRYVSQMSTGGYRDWRIPTASELAGLYKNKPYFPGSGVQWYWASKVFTTGYHTKAAIVTTEGEAAFRSEYRRVSECGAVRAVRDKTP